MWKVDRKVGFIELSVSVSRVVLIFHRPALLFVFTDFQDYPIMSFDTGPVSVRVYLKNVANCLCFKTSVSTLALVGLI